VTSNLEAQGENPLKEKYLSLKKEWQQLLEV